jgi:hypothetical protein
MTSARPRRDGVRKAGICIGLPETLRLSARGRNRSGRYPVAIASLPREIARLHELREKGALTDEQYQRAVDRLLEDR